MNRADHYASRETEDTSFEAGMREAALWEMDPERWKDGPEDRPGQAPDLSDPTYHQHPLEYLSMWWDKFPLSRPFRLMLDRLHGVLVKDQDPKALSMELDDEGDPTFTEWVQVTETTSYKAKGSELEAIVWTKVQVMLEMVAEHLESIGELTPEDQQMMEQHRKDLKYSQDQAAKVIAQRS